MNEIVSRVHPDLKAYRFRKQRHTFNRETEPGLIQVINFQMGRHSFGEEIPGLRPNLYGRFTVNLGTFISEIEALLGELRVGRFVQEYQCHVRKRLGELIPNPSDYWWPLEEDTNAIAKAIRGFLLDFGVPWLDSTKSRSLIFHDWNRQGNRMGLEPRGQFLIGLMYLHGGDRHRAIELIQDYVRQPMAHPGHLDYVASALGRIGLHEIDVPARDTSPHTLKDEI